MSLRKRKRRLTFSALIRANATRVKRWHPGGVTDWSPLEWAGAMAGEAGEACNAAKKLKRLEGKIQSINAEDRSFRDALHAKKQIVKEIADTIIYGCLLAERIDEDIELAIIQVFNQKSIEYNFPERL